MKYAEEINNSYKEEKFMFVDKIDEIVLKNSVFYSKACISPMASFFGGILA